MWFCMERGERKLAEAIAALAFELSEWRKERTTKLVTLEDLQATEKRILQAFGSAGQLSEGDQQLLDQLLARTNKHVQKLEALDAMTK